MFEREQQRARVVDGFDDDNGHDDCESARREAQEARADNSDRHDDDQTLRHGIDPSGDHTTDSCPTACAARVSPPANRSTRRALDTAAAHGFTDRSATPDRHGNGDIVHRSR